MNGFCFSGVPKITAFKPGAGFILLEVILALGISSFVGIILVTALNQTSRFQKAVQEYSVSYGHLALVKYQLTRDIMGACIPLQATVDLKQTTTVVDAEKKEKKPLEKVFYAELKDDHLDVLTFVTNNPLQVYWGAKTGRAIPRIARVVYRLVPDKKNTKSYILMRQESTHLDFNKYGQEEKDIKQFAVITNVKILSIVWLAQEKKKQEAKGEQEKQPESQAEKLIFKTKKNWLAQGKELQLPDYAQVHLELWEDNCTRTASFDFVIALPAIAAPEQKEEAQKQQGETSKTEKDANEKQENKNSDAHDKKTS